VAKVAPSVDTTYTVSVSTGATSGVSSAEVESEFDRFEALTKDLLTVSKAELNDERES
jgi:hypothetical protein